MNRFIEAIRNIFKIEELRQRIGFTALMLLVVRVGSFISVPGVDVSAVLSGRAAGANNSPFGLLDLLVGGAYSKGAIFALGVMPYISGSIIIQLLQAVVPSLHKMSQEGEEGRRQINAYTRYLTIILSLFQGIAIAISLQGAGTSEGGAPMVPAQLHGPVFVISAAMIFTAGTMFLMWIGEQITERGIGNGVSLIIFIGIVARLPTAILEEFKLVTGGDRNPVIELIILVIFVGIIAGVVLFTQAARKIPVQYARRPMGNNRQSAPGMTTTNLPIQLTTANVMPIIFASAIMFIPNFIAQYLPDGPAAFIQRNFQHSSLMYSVTEGVLIFALTFFYTAIVFSPRDVAENLRKNGGFVPGVRPGKPTEEYIDRILMRVTVPGAMFLSIVAVLPAFVNYVLGVTGNFAAFFGGTSVLIMVGVAIDTLKQIESYLLMRHYDGFMKSGKLRSRQAPMTTSS